MQALPILLGLLIQACAGAVACASEAGFPNVPRTPGDLISNGIIGAQMGRCSNITFHRGWLFTAPEQPGSSSGSDSYQRQWDIDSEAKLLNPLQVQIWNQEGVIHSPGTSHHAFQSGDYLHYGRYFKITSTRGVVQSVASSAAEVPWPSSLFYADRSALTPPWSGTINSEYGNNNVDPVFVKRNGVQVASINIIAETGIIGHPIFVGDLLIYVSAVASSGGGVATYDLSDPSKPVLLDVLRNDPEGIAIGGYWPNIHGHYIVVSQDNDRVPVAGRSGALQVIDISDPRDLKAVVRIEGSNMGSYLNSQDHYVFSGRHKINMKTMQVDLTLDYDQLKTKYNRFIHPNQFAAQYARPLGNLLAVGGIGTAEGFTIWAHQAEPDTTGPAVAYYWPRPGRTNYPVKAPVTIMIHETLRSETIVNGQGVAIRPVSANNQLGDPIACSPILADNGQLTLLPLADLASNTTYEVQVVAGHITDAAGNVMTEGATFRFSTGPTLVGSPSPGLNNPPIIQSLSLARTLIAPSEQSQLLPTPQM